MEKILSIETLSIIINFNTYMATWSKYSKLTPPPPTRSKYSKLTPSKFFFLQLHPLATNSTKLWQIILMIHFESKVTHNYSANLCMLHGGLICIGPSVCLTVTLLKIHISASIIGRSACDWLHSQKNSHQQMVMVLLLWQVGLTANIKLHFFKQWAKNLCWPTA